MIQLLDCTLRDGAHVTSGNFGKNCIISTACGLSSSGADIVELGFLKNCSYNPELSYYPRIEYALDMLKNIPENHGTEYALMARADEYDITRLSECCGKIRLIRIAFYSDYLGEAVKFAKEISARGYKFTLNMINTPGSSDYELMRAADYACEIKPYIMTIVDTFGVLMKDSLEHILKLYDERLDSGITLGLHAHENLSLAFSLAQYFVNTMNTKRNIAVDSSLMGIGRAPGNLCTELISSWLNKNYGKNYSVLKLLQLMQDEIAPIRQKFSWGYSPAYFLSAKYKVHRSYSEYFLKKGLRLDDIDKFLSRIDSEHSRKFSRDYADSLINGGQ